MEILFLVVEQELIGMVSNLVTDLVCCTYKPLHRLENMADSVVSQSFILTHDISDNYYRDTNLQTNMPRINFQ